MFERILIARRGEAAARVARTCNRHGVTAIALAREGESAGVHIDACDEVHRIAIDDDGRIAPGEVSRAAKETKADAVYPGFSGHAYHEQLAEAFAAEEDVTYVGPAADVLRRLRDRVSLRRTLEEAGIRTLPTSPEPVASTADAIAAADAIGYPATIRPVLARAGLAACHFDDDDEILDGFDAIGKPAAEQEIALMVEARLRRARAIEVLVARAADGDAVVVAEVECSLHDGRRRLLVECPSPLLVQRADGEAIRGSLGDAALRAAEALELQGLVNIRFALDDQARSYVTGVRLGLPRHHAIIEFVMDVDLVAIDLGIASGAPLAPEMHVLQARGHAFGATVVMQRREDTATPVTEIRFPPAPTRKVRFEPSVTVGQPVPPDDGDLICKVSTYAPIRHQALLTLDRMMAELEARPIATTRDEVRAALANEAIRAGQYDTETLGRVAAKAR